MDEKKRGGQSYSYGAVGGLGTSDKMRLGREEENKGVKGKRGGGGGGIYMTLQSEKQMEGGECVSSKSCCFYPSEAYTHAHTHRKRERLPRRCFLVVFLLALRHQAVIFCHFLLPLSVSCVKK